MVWLSYRPFPFPLFLAPTDVTAVDGSINISPSGAAFIALVYSGEPECTDTVSTVFPPLSAVSGAASALPSGSRVVTGIAAVDFGSGFGLCLNGSVASSDFLVVSTSPTSASPLQ